jgi:hypothetical protein
MSTAILSTKKSRLSNSSSVRSTKRIKVQVSFDDGSSHVDTESHPSIPIDFSGSFSGGGGRGGAMASGWTTFSSPLRVMSVNILLEGADIEEESEEEDFPSPSRQQVAKKLLFPRATPVKKPVCLGSDAPANIQQEPLVGCSSKTSPLPVTNHVIVSDLCATSVAVVTNEAVNMMSTSTNEIFGAIYAPSIKYPFNYIGYDWVARANGPEDIKVFHTTNNVGSSVELRYHEAVIRDDVVPKPLWLCCTAYDDNNVENGEQCGQRALGLCVECYDCELYCPFHLSHTCHQMTKEACKQEYQRRQWEGAEFERDPEAYRRNYPHRFEEAAVDEEEDTASQHSLYLDLSLASEPDSCDVCKLVVCECFSK